MKDIIPDEGRSKAGRKQILDKALKALKDNLSLPAESRESRLSEQFDPVLSVNEVCAKSLPSMLDELMDHEGDDASFIAMIRKNSGDLIAQIIGEIEEGFIDGMNDVLVFLKSLATDLLMSSAPPQ